MYIQINQANTKQLIIAAGVKDADSTRLDPQHYSFTKIRIQNFSEQGRAQGAVTKR